jgi:hypothetical protein
VTEASAHPFNDPAPQPGLILPFFRALYPETVKGWLTIFTADRHTEWYPTASLTAAATYASRQAATQNVWFGLGLRREHLKQGRGGQEDIGVLPGFAADIDPKHPVHKAQDLPETAANAQQILAGVPQQPTYLLFTGYGIQPFWLFREPWSLEDSAERQAAAHLWRRLISTLQATAGLYGWRVDSTLAHVQPVCTDGSSMHIRWMSAGVTCLALIMAA